MRGRLPSGPELVSRMPGSDQARQRLQLILGIIAGGVRVRDACRELGVSPTRLEQLRQSALKAALAALEPKPGGRPRRVRDDRDHRIAELEQRIRELERDLTLSQAREEIASLHGGAGHKKRRPSKSNRS
jgi:transposase-like protein